VRNNNKGTTIGEEQRWAWNNDDCGITTWEQ